ncbi:MAG TPA: heme o synthase [Candidatus Saccharimonadales bacterium]|nr:heme o synthase [Candidatus Saccharimonadales bacterium]
MNRLKLYYQLTKPGIIYANVMTAAAGFLLAAKGHIDVGLLLATLAGTSLVIASACVYNNFIDRKIDRKMSRTKQRALVQGLISGPAALAYASLLGVIGFAFLVFLVNMRVAVIGLIGFVDYLALYGFSKRHSVYGTLVGSISGAAPIAAGYVAVTNRIDGGAMLLYLSMVLWQMPHFYAIAMYRLKDYAAAGIPVLPIAQGMRMARIQILAYIVAFVIATSLLTVFGYTGVIFLVVVAATGLGWLWVGIRQFKVLEEHMWGRKMFLRSLVVLLLFSAMLSIGSIVP